MKIGKKKVVSVRRGIVQWYRQHQRELQWRKTSDPYEVLVSEVMLQQTQVSRVKEKLPIFLKRYPTLEELADASRADVVRSWQGLGYNNRAVRLQLMAKEVVATYNAKLPSEPTKLEKLPGIGRYTAHALACFSYRKRVPVVDVNIQRVLSRLFFRMKHPLDYKDTATIWQLAEEILPRDAYTWNQALMDFGATLCTARRPLCEECPVVTVCLSRFPHLRNGQVSSVATKEPLYAGFPRRYWRGKIVEALRNRNGKGSISITNLGKAIKPDFASHELPWLEDLVTRLEADGIIFYRRGKLNRVALAK